MRPTFKVILFAREVSAGRFPVMFRAGYAGKYRYFSLNRYAEPSQFDKKTCRFKKSFPDHRQENEILLTYEKRAADYIRDCERDGIPFSFDSLEQAVFIGQAATGGRVLWQYVEDIRAELVERGNVGNAAVYHDTANLIKAFAPKSTLQEIGADWLHRFEHFLRVRQNYRDGGISVTLRTLRAACNRAIREKLVGKDWYPFADYSLKHLEKAKSKRAISREEMRRFETVQNLPDAQRLAVDLFLFSFYTRGMNFADIAELTPANVRDLRVVYRRKKTGREYSVKLSARAAAILDRYKGSDYLFPIYFAGVHITPRQKHDRKKKMEKAVNKCLREVAAIIGVNPDGLTFYVARHTYANSLKNEGVSVAVISEALGHSDVRTTDAYLKAFGSEVLDEADEKLK